MSQLKKMISLCNHSLKRFLTNLDPSNMISTQHLIIRNIIGNGGKLTSYLMVQSILANGTLKQIVAMEKANKSGLTARYMKDFGIPIKRTAKVG
jgi:hypothetical protein